MTFCNEIDIENKINVNCRQGPAPDTVSVNSEFVSTDTDIQVDATFINPNLQPIKRLRTEAIASEIVIDEDEFL